MNKLSPRHVHGNAYLHLSDLPLRQMIQFRDWLAETDIVNVSSRSEMLDNCVHYDQYDFWFENIKGGAHHRELLEF
jgi:hypothetical protein